jgi:mannose-6-phosphate isomerase-like protein (cupin superfamily)
MHAGQTVENPITGERLVFHETAAETGGESVSFEAFVTPGGTLAAPHVHPKQTERFEIVSGTLTLQVGRKKVEAKAGDVVVIEPGTPHNFWNRGEETVRFNVEVRPALGIETLIETMYGLAADGKTNRFGMPNPFRLAVIANEHFDTVQLPVVPAWAQRAALAVGAPVGRALGYGPFYKRETAPLPSATPAFA